MKIVIIVLLVLIVISLFSALFTLVKDKGQTNRTVNALTIRVLLSIALVVTLVIGTKMGYLKQNPHPAMVDRISEEIKSKQQ
jgi:UDP-N-acetylmuramyl pentapeptide phosphotransferase/UDP-N-acetylglucosamine-1-phosphate transferase